MSILFMRESVIYLLFITNIAFGGLIGYHPMCPITSIVKPASNTYSSVEGRPVSVNLVLTERCNYHCKFCFGKYKNREFFNYDRILNIPCILKQLGTEKLTIEGGEPFLMPRLLELILEEAKNCGLTTMVISNGSLIKKEQLKRMAPYIDWLGLSIDSPNEETERFLGRGFGNHVAKVKKVAEWAHENEIYLKTNTVVTRYNLNDNLVPLLIELKPKRAKFFQFLHIEGANDEHAEELKITKEEFKEFVEQHRVLEEYGIPIAAETNEYMLGSYLMLFPDGRFFNNNYRRYQHTKHSIFDNSTLALREAMWIPEKFVQRGGIYEWDRKY